MSPDLFMSRSMEIITYPLSMILVRDDPSVLRESGTH